MKKMDGKEEFLDFLLETGALRFGDFILKSGRESPYMVDMGRMSSGSNADRIGAHFAEAIIERIGDAHVIFGPAYKGIPLCVSAAMHLDAMLDHPVHYLFDRKGQKTYADGGTGARGLVCGRIPERGESIVMIDDVITCGQTKIASVHLLQTLQPDANISGLVVAIDRQELDENGEYTAGSFQAREGIPFHSIATASDILEYLKQQKLEEHATKMQAYLNKYGIREVRQ